MSLLSDEQQLSVLRQWPEGVVNDQFEFVNLVTDIIELGLHGIVVGNGFLAHTLNLVGNTTGLYEGFYVLCDEAAVLADALYECQIVGADLQGCLFGEYLLYLMYIIY